MDLQRRTILSAALLSLTLIFFAACSAAPETLTPIPSRSPSPALAAYQTPTPSLTPSGAAPTATPIPSATATPLKYKVGKDDDMFGIAWRFGISVQALKTANPSVLPNYMGEGIELIIPVTPTPPTPTKTASGKPSQPAASISLTLPNCYPDAQGGLWCLALARNPGPGGLESPSAVFRLPSASGGKPVEQTVYAPLNVLAAGAALPMAAYFPAPISGRTAAEVQAGDSLPLAAGDPRYPAVSVQGLKTQIEGVTAAVSGEVITDKGVSGARLVWLVVVAYDQVGNPIGLRKWESPGRLSAGSSMPFNLSVYSLGPAIDHVRVLAEGHN